MKRHSLEKILECTLHYCVISEEEWRNLRSRSIGEIVRVKQILSFIASNEGYTSNEIAEFLGQHRTTVIYYVKTLKDQIVFYPPIQNLVDSIVHMLGPLPHEPQKQMITYGYLARSSTGFLTFSQHIPEMLGGYWIAEGSKPFPRDQFPQVTYETGPVKVKIKVTINKDEEV
jgi:hypothetical protein